MPARMELRKVIALMGQQTTQVALLLGVLLLTSCSRSGEVGVDEVHRKVEVRLHDGSMIVVDRSAGTRASGFPDARRGATIRQELRYEPRGLVFRVANTSEAPISLDIFGEEIYLITIFGGSESFCRNKAPGTYVAKFYRFDGKQFVRIDQQSVPVDLMSKNLMETFWSATPNSDPAFLSWRDQAERHHFDQNHPKTVTQMFARNKFLRCP